LDVYVYDFNNFVFSVVFFLIGWNMI